MNIQAWRKCSSCKKDILLKSKYFKCNVSTCNHERTGYVFCSVECFERHVPGARHRDAYAIEEVAPAAAFSAAPSTSAPTPSASPAPTARKIIPSQSTGSSAQVTPAMKKEILIVASKLKDYIRARSDMNTSQDVMNVLSDRVRLMCDRAIENARADGRKTVMDRDFSR